MSEFNERCCRECGSDRYFSENFPRLRDRLHRIEKEYERMRRQHAAEVARMELKLWEQEERQKHLQSKAHRQGQVIRRLEKKFRDRAQFPYEPEVSS